MHPLFAQLLQRRAARHEPIPGHILRTTLPPSREMSIRRPSAAHRASMLMSQPPRPLQARPGTRPPDAIDLVLDELQSITPAAAQPTPLATVTPERMGEPEGVHLRIDPQDHQRVRISGSMREVCAALDALIAVQ